MSGNTLIKIILTGTFLVIPQNISNSSNNVQRYENNSIVTEATALEKAGLEIYGENPQALGTDFFKFFRLVYSDKWDKSDPTSLFELGPKTEKELLEGKLLREELEQKYNKLFRTTNYDTLNNSWGKIINGWINIPKNTYIKWGHAALDIFTKEGNEVLTPFNGVVVASGDYWQGTFVKNEMSTWNQKGLTPRMGNAVIIYNPIDRGYLVIAHLKEGIKVKTGDVVERGQSIGCVGNSGSASIKGHGEHIHAVYKLRDLEGYLRGIDFSDRLSK
jgi:murein DD-endopeptidase MepM/ murein hydrolase activator NlpD